MSSIPGTLSSIGLAGRRVGWGFLLHSTSLFRLLLVEVRFAASESALPNSSRSMSSSLSRSSSSPMSYENRSSFQLLFRTEREDVCAGPTSLPEIFWTRRALQLHQLREERKIVNRSNSKGIWPTKYKHFFMGNLNKDRTGGFHIVEQDTRKHILLARLPPRIYVKLEHKPENKKNKEQEKHFYSCQCIEKGNNKDHDLNLCKETKIASTSCALKHNWLLTSNFERPILIHVITKDLKRQHIAKVQM